MKQLLVACILLAGFTTAKGQTTAMSHQKWEENSSDNHKNAPVHVNEFSDTEMSTREGRVYFSDLPALKKPVYAIITNADGDHIRQAKLTPEQNSISIAHMRKGLYFITIMYKNQSKKGFTLNL